MVDGIGTTAVDRNRMPNVTQKRVTRVLSGTVLHTLACIWECTLHTCKGPTTLHSTPFAHPLHTLCTPFAHKRACIHAYVAMFTHPIPLSSLPLSKCSRNCSVDIMYLRHYDESSECATARQHKVADVACCRLERTLMGCAVSKDGTITTADPPFKGCRGYHPTIRVPRVTIKKRGMRGRGGVDRVVTYISPLFKKPFIEVVETHGFSLECTTSYKMCTVFNVRELKGSFIH